MQCWINGPATGAIDDKIKMVDILLKTNIPSFHPSLIPFPGQIRKSQKTSIFSVGCRNYETLNYTWVERFGATPFGLPTSLFELRRDTSTPHAGFNVPGCPPQNSSYQRDSVFIDVNLRLCCAGSRNYRTIFNTIDTLSLSSRIEGAYVFEICFNFESTLIIASTPRVMQGSEFRRDNPPCAEPLNTQNTY